MCYSAQIWQSYQKYVRVWGADVGIKEFHRLYWLRSEGAKIRIPKAMDASFAQPATDEEFAIKALITTYDFAQVARLEQEIFGQRKRLVDAERILQRKATKAATENQRIATDKIARAMDKLADLRRGDPAIRDSRTFPGWHAPVMIMENGRRMIKPMRYQCRLAGKPASFDRRFPGCYNARRDNIERFWKGAFGVSHGIMAANAFYENVSRHRVEGRELAPGEKDENMILEFRPRPTQDMLIACLWSHWQGENEPDLLSFAAITDTPPPEVAAAGHDRCIIPIKPGNVDAWLNPDPANLAAQYAILDDRERPYYEYRVAA